MNAFLCFFFFKSFLSGLVIFSWFWDWNEQLEKNKQGWVLCENREFWPFLFVCFWIQLLHFFVLCVVGFWRWKHKIVNVWFHQLLGRINKMCLFLFSGNENYDFVWSKFEFLTSFPSYGLYDFSGEFLTDLQFSLSLSLSLCMLQGSNWKHFKIVKFPKIQGPMI